MANDIYGRNAATLAGIFTADNARLTLQGNLSVLVQQMRVNYTQNIARLYEVGSTNMYYIGGRTQGQMAIDRVIGPASTVINFYNTYGDVCKSIGRNITFTLDTSSCNQNGTNTTMTITNSVITSVSLGVGAQDMIISDNTTLIYTSLQSN